MNPMSAISVAVSRDGTPGATGGGRRWRWTESMRATRPAAPPGTAWVSGPARTWDVDVDGADLAAAWGHQLGVGHAAPFGGRDEQGRLLRAAEGAGEPAAVQGY